MSGLAGGLTSTPVASLGCPKPSVLWGPRAGEGAAGWREGAVGSCGLPSLSCLHLL